MKINRAYKYRLYPTDVQRQSLSSMFGCIRKTYNYFLNERIEQYKEWKNLCSLAEQAKEDKPKCQWFNYYTQANKLKPMKQKSEFEWLKIAPSQAYQQALKHLQSAFDNFLKHKAKYPKFKRMRGHNSFSVSQQAKIVDNKVQLSKVGLIKAKISKVIPQDARILSSTFSCNGNPKHPKTKFYVSFAVEEEYQSNYKHTNRQVGIDLGLIDKVVCSDGLRFPSSKFYKKYDRKLKSAQKHLSRKWLVNKRLGIKESKRYENQVAKVANLYIKMVSCRTDYNQKISTYLVRNYDVISAEDLSIKNMQKNHKLARSISNEGWFDLCRMLEYKARWNNKLFVQVNPKDTSKTCSNCGYILDKKLSLSVRSWVCPKCNQLLDRDLNASKNILASGLYKLASVGTHEYNRGDDVRLSSESICQ